MGVNLKRRRKPTGAQAAKAIHHSPELGKFWILDIAAKATYYPDNLTAFKRTYARLRGENKELKTSHKISA
jgi:hypothetical protein